MVKSNKFYLTTRYRFRALRSVIERMRVAASARLYGREKSSPSLVDFYHL